MQTYVLDAGGAPGATLLSLPLGNVLSFSATVPDAIYYVRLRAVTPAGSGPASNEVQIALGQAAPPQPPLALLATVQGTAVTLQWTENPLGAVIGELSAPGRHAPAAWSMSACSRSPATTRTLSVNAPPGTYFVRLVAAERGRREPAVERGDRHDRRRDLHDSRGADRAAGDQRRWGDHRALERRGGGRDSAAATAGPAGPVSGGDRPLPSPCRPSPPRSAAPCLPVRTSSA